MTQPIGAPAETERSIDNLLAAVRDLLDTDPRSALEQAEMLLPGAPDPRVFRLAAAACRRLGMTADAEDAELAAIQAGFRDSELNGAAVAGQEGRNSEARDMVERFLQREPDDLLALTMAAESDINAWQLERAEGRLRTVLDRAPSFLRAIMLLARCLALQARIREAIGLVEDVVRRKPGNRTALQYLGEIAAEANDHDKSVEIYGRILQSDPKAVDLWIVYAQHLRILGRRDEAKAAFRRALALDPGNGAAWWGLTYYFTPDVTDADVGAMRDALTARGDSAEDGGPLHLALSIIDDRRGDHAEAFRHVSAGKQLRERANPYNPDVAARDVDHMLRVFTPERFEALGSVG